MCTTRRDGGAGCSSRHLGPLAHAVARQRPPAAISGPDRESLPDALTIRHGIRVPNRTPARLRARRPALTLALGMARPDVCELLARSENGEAISRDDGCALIHVTGSDLAGLMLAASRLRDRHKGRTVTYSRTGFIPLTNLCRDTCGYCTFVRQPEDPKAHTMTPEEVLAVARGAQRAGCKEALFSLGDKPELKYPEYRGWLN